jgi:hypothetical protein
MCRSLRNDPRVRVLAPSRQAHVRMSAPMLRLALAELEAKSGVSSAELVPYAGDLFYVRIHWLGPPDATGLSPLGGEIRLQGVANWTRPLEAAPGWSSFDDHPGSGDGVLTVVRPHDGRWQWGVFEHGVVEPMEIDIAGYMQALLDLRGLFGWQWLFVPKARRRAGQLPPNRRERELSARLEGHERLFETDLSAYRARL